MKKASKKDLSKQSKEMWEKVEEYENSLEGIFERLPSIADAVNKDEENKTWIAKTLFKLPKDIREKVLNEVIFIHTATMGTVARAFIKKEIGDENELKEINKYKIVSMEQPIIILNFKHVKDSIKMDMVAHEIAHFILGHDKSMHSGTWEEGERAADDLAEKWGFNRSYKKYK